MNPKDDEKDPGAKYRLIGITPETVLRALFVGNNLNTFNVLLDRAAWFSKGHEALSLDGMAAIRKMSPDFPGGNDASRAMYVAYSYATAVFLASAIETLLLLTYINSVVLFYNWKDTIPAFLERRLIEKKKTRALGPLEMELRSLSVINLSETEKWFDEIYGNDLFGRMVGAKRSKTFRAKFAELISNRNSILHRGGESKKGDFIEIRLDELETLSLEAGYFGRKLVFSILEWWLKQLAHDPKLTTVVLKSI